MSVAVAGPTRLEAEHRDTRRPAAAVSCRARRCQEVGVPRETVAAAEARIRAPNTKFGGRADPVSPRKGSIDRSHGRSACGNGSGRSSTWSSTVNAAVVAAMPSAMTATAASAKPGARRSEPKVCRKSSRASSSHCVDPASRTRSVVCMVPPSFRSAERRASSGAMPARMLSSMCAARCAFSSAARSSSRSFFIVHASSGARNRARIACACSQSRVSRATCFLPARVSW